MRKWIETTGRSEEDAIAAALFQLAVPASGFYWLPPLDGYQIQVWISAGLLGLGTLLSLDVLWAGLRRALRGRVEMDTLAALSVLFTLADALTLSLSQDREGQLPYAAAALAGLFFLLHGSYHKRCGLRLSCRTAASAAGERMGTGPATPKARAASSTIFLSLVSFTRQLTPRVAMSMALRWAYLM